MNNEERSPAFFEHEDQKSDLGELLSQLFDMLRRRKWYVMAPIPVAVAAGVAIALYLPSKYQSEALIGVMRPKVSEKYVPSDTPIAETVGALERQIRSRASLVKVAQELDIYGNGAPPAEQAERLSTELVTEPIYQFNQLSALRVSFISTRPEIAQRVTSRVVALFMEENLQSSEDQVVTTQSFLRDQVAAAEQRLAEQAAKVQAYKARYTGQLPDQQPLNLQILNDLRGRLQTVSSDLERARRDRRELENEISGRLNRLQAERSELLKKYTPQYSEVKKKDAEIALYSALLSPSGAAALAGVEDIALRQLRARIEQNSHDLEDFEREENSLRTQIRDYQARVNSAPLRDLELSELERDYNLLKSDYESLKAKEMQSGLTADLVVTQNGEQFRIIEPPTFPRRPSGPNRLKIGLIAVAAGLALGLALAFFREKLDPSFQSELAAKTALDVPLVIGVPLIWTPRELATRRWRTLLTWMVATGILVFVVTAELFLYTQR